MPSKLKRNAVAIVTIFIALYSTFRSQHALLPDNNGARETATQHNAQQDGLSEPIVDLGNPQDLSDTDLDDNDDNDAGDNNTTDEVNITTTILGDEHDGGSNHTRRVEFVHITKTGGSAIEMAGGMAGIIWGACHYHHVGSSHCPEGSKDFDNRSSELDKGALHNSNVVRVKNFSKWHIPPNWFKDNPFEGSITFTMVRNPYTRVISEYYCPWTGYKGAQKGDPQIMNDWTRKRINVAMIGDHYLPQYFYVYDKFGKQVIDEVLHFENFKSDIMEFSQKHELGIAIPHKTNIAKVTGNEKKLTIHDLDNKTICTINQVYKTDFEKFNYTMMTC